MTAFTLCVLLLTCAATAFADAPVIVAFGDSITFGAHLKPEESYPAQLQTLLREQPGLGDATVRNAGVGGDTAVQGLARLDKDVLAHRPCVVLIGFGMNDSVMVAAGQSRVPVEEFSQTLTEMVRRVQAAGAVAILAPVTPVIEDYYFDRHPREWYPQGLKPVLDGYTAAICEVAKQTGAQVVDFSALDPTKHLRTPQNSNARDGVHMTAEGYAVMARAYAMSVTRSQPAQQR